MCIGDSLGYKHGWPLDYMHRQLFEFYAWVAFWVIIIGGCLGYKHMWLFRL